MQPSSLRVGAISARSSASSKNACPSRDLRMTASVTASLGSFPLPRDLLWRLPVFFLLERFAFFLAMMAGIVLQWPYLARGTGRTRFAPRRLFCVVFSPGVQAVEVQHG